MPITPPAKSHSAAHHPGSIPGQASAYVWTGAFNASHNYVVNGLNQYSSLGSAIFSYDANGNLTGDGVYSYVYDVENRMVSAAKISGNVTTASLRYDPLGRLYQNGGGSGGLTRFLHDGDELVAEFDGNTNILLRRYLHGVSVDDPVIAYEGSAFNQPRWLHTNHQGSIVAISDNLGVVTAKNTFDEWGIEGSGNASIAAGGRFSYTGQAWIPELGMYYYKARIYSATLGRFMQTDPIGYADGMNIYAYVGGDPVNRVDPNGMEASTVQGPVELEPQKPTSELPASTVGVSVDLYLLGGVGFELGLVFEQDNNLWPDGVYAAGEAGYGVDVSVGLSATFYDRAKDINGKYLTAAAGIGVYEGGIVTDVNGNEIGQSHFVGLGATPVSARAAVGTTAVASPKQNKRFENSLTYGKAPFPYDPAVWSLPAPKAENPWLKPCTGVICKK